MAAKLSKAQQDIVDQMQAGAYIAFGWSSYGLFEGEGEQVRRVQGVSERTLLSLRKKGIVKPAESSARQHRNRYVLTPEYQPEPTPADHAAYEALQADEPAPLVDQPSFPHSAHFARAVRVQKAVTGGIGAYEMYYVNDYNVSPELARAAIRYILQEQS